MVLIIGIGFALFSKKKEIQFLFAGNISQKYTKLEKKIISGMVSGKIEKEFIGDFQEISLAFFNSEPTNPSAHHGLAKAAYYELVTTNFSFDVDKLLHFVTNSNSSSTSLTEVKPILDKIYRNALRAKVFRNEFPEMDSNQLLISLCETLEGRKRPALILEQLIQIKYENISPELKPIFLWLNFITTVNSGDLDALEAIFEMNKKLESGLNIKIKKREFGFLMGIANYNQKEYVQALQYFRESRIQKMDFLTIESIKFEASIFHIQNLHEKAISLLENLYTTLNTEDETIKEKIRLILLTKPGLRSKLVGLEQ